VRPKKATVPTETTEYTFQAADAGFILVVRNNTDDMFGKPGI